MNQSTAKFGLAQHPLSAAFPGMGALEFADLKLDIEQNGVQQPITVFEDMVLDGWHRYRACSELGLGCPSIPFSGADPRRFVLSLNLNRRHLTASQKASAVVACNAWAPEGRPEKQATGLPVSTVAKMAEEAGVSRETIKQAKKAHSAGLGEAVKAGKVSVKRAAEIADLPEPEREAAIEAPAPKKEKKAEPVRVDEMGALKQKVHELEEELQEAADAVAMAEAFQEQDRILAADDQVAQAWAEVKRLKAENRVLRERVDGLMSEKNEMTKEAKRWMKKFQALEKKTKADLAADTTFEKGA